MERERERRERKVVIFPWGLHPVARKACQDWADTHMEAI
jgi:hypothetical protein